MRFSLSTACAMMFTAALVLAMSALPDVTYLLSRVAHLIERYGWPAVFYTREVRESIITATTFDGARLFADLICGMPIVLAAGAIWEWCLRRALLSRLQFIGAAVSGLALFAATFNICTYVTPPHSPMWGKLWGVPCDNYATSGEYFRQYYPKGIIFNLVLWLAVATTVWIAAAWVLRRTRGQAAVPDAPATEGQSEQEVREGCSPPRPPATDH